MAAASTYCVAGWIQGGGAIETSFVTFVGAMADIGVVEVGSTMCGSSFGMSRN